MPRDRERDREPPRQQLAERELRTLFDLHLRFRENDIEKYYATNSSATTHEGWQHRISNYLASADAVAARAKVLARAGFHADDFRTEPKVTMTINIVEGVETFTFTRPSPKTIFSVCVDHGQLEWIKFDNDSMWPAFRKSLRRPLPADP